MRRVRPRRWVGKLFKNRGIIRNAQPSLGSTGSVNKRACSRGVPLRKLLCCERGVALRSLVGVGRVDQKCEVCQGVVSKVLPDRREVVDWSDSKSGEGRRVSDTRV